MNKEQLIKRIGDVVMKNSKKGILTTTKFVGTYNYKSGYDSYFAVSLDMNKVLVVYSYYQNDRGEHIDTPTYKLSDLPEKELQEVYNNLNTEDKYVLEYVGWTETEEVNKAILEQLGVYKPKKAKVKQLSVDDIPELENEDDAYVIDRDNNISILKCAGRTPWGKKVFVVEQDYEGNYAQPLYDDKPYTFCDTGKFRKNKGIFVVALGYEDTSDAKYLFVPDKKTLVGLIKKTNKFKDYFIVREENLMTFKKTLGKDPDDEEDAKFFTDKTEATNYFEVLRKRKLESLTTLKIKLEKRIKETKDATKGVELVSFNDTHIRHTNGVVGQLYYIHNDQKYYGPFKLIKSENGIGYFEGGAVTMGWNRIATPEDMEKYKMSEKFKTLKEHIESLEREIHWVEQGIKDAASIIPFSTKDKYVPSWIEKEAKDTLKKPIPVPEFAHT